MEALDRLTICAREFRIPWDETLSPDDCQSSISDTRAAHRRSGTHASAFQFYLPFIHRNRQVQAKHTVPVFRSEDGYRWMVIDDWLFNNENKGRPKTVGGIRMITSRRDLTDGEGG